jgi:hypothetical protein
MVLEMIKVVIELHSPAIISVTICMLSKAGDSEAGGL